MEQRALHWEGRIGGRQDLQNVHFLESRNASDSFRGRRGYASMQEISSGTSGHCGTHDMATYIGERLVRRAHGNELRRTVGVPHAPAPYRPPGRRPDQRSAHKLKQREQYHTTAWRRLRAWVLERDLHLCQHCGSPVGASGHVDHIRPVRTADEVICDESNLQTLCEKCHNAKTAKEMHGGQV